MPQNIIIKRIIKSLIGSCLFLIISTSVFAANMQYLRYSPVAEFTSEDFKMLETTGKAALNENKDGEESEWKNTDSGNSGAISIINSSTIDGMKCRKVKILNQTETHSGHATFTFCQVADKKWKILK